MRLEIRNLQCRLKTTSVFVTHDQLEAMTLADTLVVMQDGRIEQTGTPFEVYSNPEAIKFGVASGDGLNLAAEIEGVEVLGPDSMVHLNLAGVKDTLVAKVDTDPTFPINGPIDFEVNLSD